MAEPRKEPRCVYATVRESRDEFCDVMWDVECRFEDGQKFAAVRVDGDFPELADRIARAISLDDPRF